MQFENAICHDFYIYRAYKKKPSIKHYVTVNYCCQKNCAVFVTLKYCKFSCRKSLNKTASDHFSIFTNRCTPISTLYDIKHRPSKRGVILILSYNF